MAASALDDSCAVAEGAPTEASTLSVVPRMAPAGSRTDGHSAFVYTPTTISLTFHICRASGYYLLRAVLPMAIVGAFGLCSLLMEADELAARLSLTLSAFVANVTLVFVIAAFLPKLSHLTAIDRLVTVTMCAIGATALAAVAADLAMQARGPEAGHACDRVARRVIPAFYAAAALATILVPAIRNHRARRLLFADYRDPLGGAGGQLTFVHTHTAEAVHVWNAVARCAPDATGRGTAPAAPARRRNPRAIACASRPRAARLAAGRGTGSCAPAGCTTWSGPMATRPS